MQDAIIPIIRLFPEIGQAIFISVQNSLIARNIPFSAAYIINRFPVFGLWALVTFVGRSISIFIAEKHLLGIAEVIAPHISNRVTEPAIAIKSNFLTIIRQ